MEDLDVDGSAILQRTLKIGWKVVGYFNPTYDRDKWLVFVNTVMNTVVSFLRTTPHHGDSLGDYSLLFFVLCFTFRVLLQKSYGEIITSRKNH